MISNQETLGQIQDLKLFQEEFHVIPDQLYDFILSVEKFYYKRGFISQKQANSINKLIHSCNDYLTRMHNKRHGF